MKKVFVLILAVSMMFLFCACGESDTTTEVLPEKIEIDNTNWNEYFELVSGVKWEDDEEGNVAGLYVGDFFCIKERYVDKILIEESDFDVTVSFNMEYVKFKYDIENRSISSMEHSDATVLFPYKNERVGLSVPRDLLEGNSDITLEADGFYPILSPGGSLYEIIDGQLANNGEIIDSGGYNKMKYSPVIDVRGYILVK